MIPFRVFDRERKEMWIVLNYQADSRTYLCAREDDSDNDGALKSLDLNQMNQMRLVDFLDDGEEYGD